MSLIGYTSCFPQEEPTPSEMVFATTEFSVSADGGVIELKFVPTSSWSASCQESFISYDPKSGDASENEVVMTINVDKNKKEARKAVLTLSFETNDVLFTIDQEGKTPKMKLDETEFSAKAEGDQIEISFDPVSDWTATCEEEWISFNPKSGKLEDGAQTMVVKVAENETEGERVAELVLSFASNDVKVTITQDGKEVPKVKFEKNEFSLPAEGGQVKVEFIPLTKWSASSEESFVSFDPKDGKASSDKVTLTITVAKNTLDTKRTASVKVKFDNNEEVISISQDGVGPRVEIAQTEYEADWKGDNFTIRFVTPTATKWTVTSDQNFVLCDRTSSESYAGQNNMLELIVKENNFTHARTATVKLSFDSNDVFINITQKARPADIVVSQSHFNVSAAGETVQFTFVGTSDWNLTHVGDFINYTPKYGYESSNTVTVYVTVNSNEQTESRSAYLTLTSETNAVTVTINQTGTQVVNPDDPNPDDPNPDDPNPDNPNIPDVPGSDEMIGGTEDVNKGDDINIRR